MRFPSCALGSAPGLRPIAAAETANQSRARAPPSERKQRTKVGAKAAKARSKAVEPAKASVVRSHRSHRGGSHVVLLLLVLVLRDVCEEVVSWWAEDAAKGEIVQAHLSLP